MAKFISLESLWNKKARSKFVMWYDSLTFLKILIIWAAIIFIFGGIYYYFSSQGSFLLDNSLGGRITNLLDAIYFSFITATTTGFGDIVPIGMFKFIATLEVIFGLLLLALVTSKLVSIKQDEILEEVYEISFNEKINRVRSSLLVFRQNISRLRTRIEEGTIRKREIHDIYIQLSSLEDILRELITFISRQKESHFKKSLGHVNAELILNSVLMSFKKIVNLLDDFDEAGVKWRREITIKFIERCISLDDELFSMLKNLAILTLDEISNFERDREEVKKILLKKIK